MLPNSAVYIDLKAAGYILGEKTNTLAPMLKGLFGDRMKYSRVIQIFKIHLFKSCFETFKGFLIPVFPYLIRQQAHSLNSGACKFNVIHILKHTDRKIAKEYFSRKPFCVGVHL